MKVIKLIYNKAIIYSLAGRELPSSKSKFFFFPFLTVGKKVMIAITQYEKLVLIVCSVIIAL